MWESNFGTIDYTISQPLDNGQDIMVFRIEYNVGQ
jgi:hypothetical protein